MVAAGGGGDLGRVPERHQRIPRAGGGCVRRAGGGQGRAGGRGQRGRRHGHGLLRIQGRHRHELPQGGARTRWACWCSATADGARSFASRACRWGRRSRGTSLTRATSGTSGEDVGSIIIVVATDAPLLPHQMKRLARRASLGVARTGSISGNGSGDIFIAFSTANPDAGRTSGVVNLTMLPNDEMNKAVRGYRGGHRGGHRQRHGRGRNHDRLRGTYGDRAAARPAAGGFEEVQPVGAVNGLLNPSA